MIVAKSPAHSEVRSHVLAMPNPIHLVAYVIASTQILIIQESNSFGFTADVEGLNNINNELVKSIEMCEYF